MVLKRGIRGRKTRNPGEENAESGDDFPGGIQNFRGGITRRFELKRGGPGGAGRLSGEKTGGLSGGNTGGKKIFCLKRGGTKKRVGNRKTRGE
jgi:hypothetical protein